MLKLQEYKVLIRCITYNHSQYITDTLKGFVMQQTDFPFVIVLLDDASTDGTKDMIRSFISDQFDIEDSIVAYERETEHAHISYAQHKTNRNCFVLVHYLKYNHYQNGKKKLHYVSEWRKSVKYETLCEGDDYWTDPLKLQVQVDFMDANPDYSFCCHRFDIYEQNKDRWLKEYAHDHYVEDRNLEITTELYSKVWVTQPLTLMARMSSLEKIESDLKEYRYRRDVHLFYHLLTVGKGVSLNRKMGVYRWHDGGVASSKSGVLRFQTAYGIYKELLQKTQDPVFRGPFVKNTIRLIRYKSFSSDLIRIVREAWRYSRGWREKKDILISFFTPLFIVNWITARYRKHYLSTQTL